MTSKEDSVDDALGADHEQLGDRLARLREGISAQSPEASGVAAAFARELLHHMAWEETYLFPAAKARSTAAQRRSIESLEIDHERLRGTLDLLLAAVAARDYPTSEATLSWLLTLLRGHNYDEEHGVYVEADRNLPAEERRRLLQEFRRKESP